MCLILNNFKISKVILNRKFLNKPFFLYNTVNLKSALTTSIIRFEIFFPSKTITLLYFFLKKFFKNSNLFKYFFFVLNSNVLLKNF